MTKQNRKAQSTDKSARRSVRELSDAEIARVAGGGLVPSGPLGGIIGGGGLLDPGTVTGP